MGKGITVIITMAGIGERYRKAGYDCPKYMIMAKGKTLFSWAMESLTGYREHVIKYIFVVRKEDNSSDFIYEQCEKCNIKNIELVELESRTDGQATTCMHAIPYCDIHEAVLIYNIDTYVEPDKMTYESISGDGYIPCFKGDGDQWSFVKLDDENKAVEVREKVRISDNCTLGAYYFSSAQLYADLYKEYYANDSHMEKNEKYIAPLYNLMIEKGMVVTISMIDKKCVHTLGTPEELECFISGEE